MEKYLFITPSLSKGGAERVAVLLANHLAKRGKEVIFIIHFYTHQNYHLDEKVKLICLSELQEVEYRKKINLFYLIKLMKRLRKKVLLEKPSYIIPFLWTTCLRTHFSLIFTKYNNKIIYTVRNNPSIFPKNKWIRKYRDYLIKQSKLTIVQNKKQKEYFLNRKNIEILPNPVNDDILNINLENHDTKNVNIVGVGRLNYQKNFQLLINAVSELIDEGINVSLKIYGEGEEFENLNSLIMNNRKNASIELCGRSNDYSEIYSNADVYVLSSKFEGMPNTLLEAMAVGIACISTNCETGPADIILDGIDGLLIPVDDKETLKQKIKFLYDNPELRKQMGAKAKEKIIKKYKADIIGDLFIKYTNLLKK